MGDRRMTNSSNGTTLSNAMTFAFGIERILESFTWRARGASSVWIPISPISLPAHQRRCRKCMLILVHDTETTDDLLGMLQRHSPRVVRIAARHAADRHAAGSGPRAAGTHLYGFQRRHDRRRAHRKTAAGKD
jgi:hypothetical protein